MKKQRLKTRLIAAFLLVLFFALVLWGGYSIENYGNRWFSSKWNARIHQQKENVITGNIYDRSGVLLASTVDGKRVYASDPQTRSAAVHVIGDSEGRISGGADSFFATYLHGFQTSFRELCTQLIRRIPRTGDTIHLTLDSKLNRTIVQLFNTLPKTTGKTGAAVVMNYQTGEILGMVSLPVFDPAMSSEQTTLLSGQPYTNRAAQSQLAPGSAFQIVTAASALEKLPEVASLSLLCSGMLSVKDSDIPIHDWGYSAHGYIALKDAFVQNCSSYFAQLALAQLGDARLKNTAEAFGFNENFLFHDLVLSNSVYPVTNRSYREIAMSGIGQSGITASPLHLCMIASSIANDGIMMEPVLLKHVTGASGTAGYTYTPKTYRKPVSASTAKAIKEYMRATVFSGTEAQAQAETKSICGTAGPAEAEMNGQPITNDWFVGFIDDSTLPVAVCVLVENIDEQEGGASAAPVAAKIFEYVKQHPELVRADMPAAATQPASPSPTPAVSPTPGPTGVLDPLVDIAGHLGLITTATPDPAVTPAPTGFLDTINGVLNNISNYLPK